ncbi:MAG: carboxylating nicotinate-nucleotide diphosphorylase [Oscillospiraceae bacterium]|nr:carboxylating nicotinate-nucleotide diphosphorylase [Oscillospiraceae bacterium]
MMLPELPDYYTDDLIKNALKEDINYIDVTTDLLIQAGSRGEARIIAKEDGVLAGIGIASRVFRLLDSTAELTHMNDGQSFKKGDKIAEIKASAAAILKAERTALNFLQHMSGIATYTQHCVEAVSGTGVQITDTRKTLPGLRVLQKYAVLCGGGCNHRFNLTSAAMIKDNHADFFGGSVSTAIKTLRERVGHMVVIEAEVRDFEQLREAIDAGADVIMLDNMNTDMMREAVKITAARAKLEASGNITLQNIRETAETGIDIISLGALSHSVKALDLSLQLRTCLHKQTHC